MTRGNCRTYPNVILHLVQSGVAAPEFHLASFPLPAEADTLYASRVDTPHDVPFCLEFRRQKPTDGIRFRRRKRLCEPAPSAARRIETSTAHHRRQDCAHHKLVS